jgi:hypothetical protein
LADALSSSDLDYQEIAFVDKSCQFLFSGSNRGMLRFWDNKNVEASFRIPKDSLAQADFKFVSLFPFLINHF